MVELILQALYSGVLSGSSYALIALGLALVFGTMKRDRRVAHHRRRRAGVGAARKSGRSDQLWSCRIFRHWVVRLGDTHHASRVAHRVGDGRRGLLGAMILYSPSGLLPALLQRLDRARVGAMLEMRGVRAGYGAINVRVTSLLKGEERQ